jgi:serine/threonine protein kinase
MLEHAAGGRLYWPLARETFTEARMRLYAAQMLLAVCFLHPKGIAHCRLNPKAVLIDRDGYLRITDFAWAMMDGAQSTASTFWGRRNTSRRSCCRVGPHKERRLVEFRGHRAEDARENYRVPGLRERPHAGRVPGDMLPRARDLIGKLLGSEPSKRLGEGEADYEEIKAHELFAGINWDALLKKEIEMEWRPQLS